LEKFRAFRLARMNARSQVNRMAAPAFKKEVGEPDTPARTEQKCLAERLPRVGGGNAMKSEQIPERSDFGVTSPELRE